MAMIRLMFLFSVLSLTGCKKECPEQGTVTDSGEIHKCSILTGSAKSSDEYIVTSELENTVAATVKFNGNQSYESIDFDTYSLIGKKVSSNVNTIFHSRDVEVDSTNKKVLVTISIEECQDTKEPHPIYTWILTDKLEDGYEVEFNIEKS